MHVPTKTHSALTSSLLCADTTSDFDLYDVWGSAVPDVADATGWMKDRTPHILGCLSFQPWTWASVIICPSQCLGEVIPSLPGKLFSLVLVEISSGRKRFSRFLSISCVCHRIELRWMCRNYCWPHRLRGPCLQRGPKHVHRPSLIGPWACTGKASHKADTRASMHSTDHRVDSI